jgi:hypothetical protein
MVRDGQPPACALASEGSPIAAAAPPINKSRRFICGSWLTMRFCGVSAAFSVAL